MLPTSAVDYVPTDAADFHRFVVEGMTANRARIGAEWSSAR